MAFAKPNRVFTLPPIDSVAIYVATMIAFLSIVLLFIVLACFAIPVLLQTGSTNPFSWVWAPSSQQFGIMPMLVGSLLLSLSAIVLAFPLALAIACWIVALGRGYWLAAVKAIVYFMTAIPTVVYGFVAIFLLPPLIRQALGSTGLCWLTAALMLTVLILPTMILVMVSTLQTRLEQLGAGALAIGFNKLELIWFFVLPQAKSSLLAATALGFGRAIGDTLLPLMLAGNATHVPLHLTDSLRSLSAHMALVTANEVGGYAYSSLFAAGFLLLLINALLSLVARRLGAKPALQGYMAMTVKGAKI